MVDASDFPSVPQFRILIDAEILLVTAVSGNTFTADVVEGTAAATHADSATVRHILTAGGLDSAFVRKDAAEVVTVPEADAPPGSNPASGFYLYVDPADDTIRVRGPSGTITVIGPA